MSKRKLTQREERNLEQSQSQPVEKDSWDTPGFRNEVLWTMVFVALPATVMLALGEYKIAAAWFGVGALIVIYESRRQLRSFWRSLRSGEHTDPKKD